VEEAVHSLVGDACAHERKGTIRPLFSSKKTCAPNRN
jgi:hypothetical protein